ncbi:hypothetical protein C8A05DRAFT_34751 [Staphylotrichum tortipilum]|uniref:Uncharacterized protein n=1 Tax=Staphylotrichum tortipilum TaxID=2831512 RepID=A0AAN6RS99_9PEZI|nr:hypothetical protein C8A05DRAFT_34751 [Staphylotrichum longicolle]
MSDLRPAVYTAPPTPAVRLPQASITADWSPISCTLIYSTQEAVLGDHFFGLPLLLEAFPSAVPVATEGTVRHMEQQIQEPYYTATWKTRFPNGQIAKPFQLAQALPYNPNALMLGAYGVFKDSKLA